MCIYYFLAHRSILFAYQETIFWHILFDTNILFLTGLCRPCRSRCLLVYNFNLMNCCGYEMEMTDSTITNIVLFISGKHPLFRTFIRKRYEQNTRKHVWLCKNCTVSFPIFSLSHASALAKTQILIMFFIYSLSYF